MGLFQSHERHSCRHGQIDEGPEIGSLKPSNKPDQGRAILVRDLDDALAALAAAKDTGKPVTLLSAPGAAASLGPLWWKALLEAAAKVFPSVTFDSLLDCGDLPGPTMAAIGARVGPLLFTGSPQLADKLASMAKAAGLPLHREAPEFLDLSVANETENPSLQWLQNSLPNKN